MESTLARAMEEKEADVEINWYQLWKFVKFVHFFSIEKRGTFLFTPLGIQALTENMQLSLPADCLYDYVCRRCSNLTITLGRLEKILEGNTNRKLKGIVKLHLEGEFTLERDGSEYTLDKTEYKITAEKIQKKKILKTSKNNMPTLGYIGLSFLAKNFKYRMTFLL